MGTISRHFSYSEFERSKRADELKIDNHIPDSITRANVWALVMSVLEPLREAWKKPLKVNSGYRCPQVNAAVGGVPTSQHTKGEAADIQAADPFALATLARDLKIPYDQMILYPDFVHFSHRARGAQRGQILYSKTYKGRKL